MWNKNYLYLILVIAVIGTAFVLYRGYEPSDLVNVGVSPDLTQTPILLPSDQPTITPKPVSSSKPGSGIIIEEKKSHDVLALEFDEDGNRRLVLNEDCTALIPSQVAYKNNVQIMLDNTYSSKPHILKIGGVEYSLGAGEWFLTTLSRPSIPAQLPIFCGSMELGQIDLL